MQIRALVLTPSLAVLAVIGCGGPDKPANKPTDAVTVTAQPDAAAAAPAVADAAAHAEHSVDTGKSHAHAGPPHWSYTEAPDKWGDLSGDWTTCKTGKSQSPIDIPAGVQKGKLSPIAFSYKPFPLEIFNNGHTVQAKAVAGNTITAGPTANDKYDLLQIHAHAPSEHTLDKKPLDAEIHFVHKNAAGALAVVGVLLKKGKENAALKAYFENAPGEVSEGPKPVAGATVDLAPLVGGKPSYYSYSGSLTTPPCSEGVSWYVLAQPVEISEAQLKKFQDATKGGPTNRPPQPLGTRALVQFKP